MNNGRTNLSAQDSICIAISLGDPQGIGEEVTLAALPSCLTTHVAVRVLVFGAPSGEFDKHRRALDQQFPGRIRWIDLPYHAEGPPPSRAAGEVSLLALAAAADAVDRGDAQCLVTAPLAKAAVSRVSPGFVGHTEWLARRYRRSTVMLLAGQKLRVFLVSDHVPLIDVSRMITAERLEFVLRLSRDVLVRDFGCPSPRLAVLGLNPHAGEWGELGREEVERIIPAIKRAGGASAGFYGPFAADSFFVPGHAETFDGVIAMYHDQGLIPFKSACFADGINITLGLNFPRTSPDHGTAFELAGRGQASWTSMANALDFAVRQVKVIENR